MISGLSAGWEKTLFCSHDVQTCQGMARVRVLQPTRAAASKKLQDWWKNEY